MFSASREQEGRWVQVMNCTSLQSLCFSLFSLWCVLFLNQNIKFQKLVTKTSENSAEEVLNS